MKIALLGAANSVHLARIANAILAKGHEVLVISLPNHRDVDNVIRTKIFYLKHSGGKGYYLNALELKKILKEENVDILNSHYASGYGTLGRLSNFHPTILSVWGSDVYSFPNEHLIKKIILKRNLKSADLLFSTSNCMADETRKYIGKKKNIVTTPFGVDTSLFSIKEKRKQSEYKVTFGFLKGTDPIYGIDIFLEAFKNVFENFRDSDYDINAIICGSDKQNILNNLLETFEISNYVKYLGRVPHAEMADIINMCDIVCIPSREESFGVIAIEAMSSGTPCITSQAPGLAEVMINNKTGFVVNNEVDSFTKAMSYAVTHKEDLKKMQRTCREHVLENYNFEKNIEIFLNEFKVICGISNGG